MKKTLRIACGMSGGVDSSVAALLLKRKGHDVIGVFMRNWESSDEIGECSADTDLEDAHKTCLRLGIELKEVSFVKDYWNWVFSETLNDYEAGLTPNPDVLCNRHIKFDSFYRHCTTCLGADAIAMGHYARTNFGWCLENYRDGAMVKLLKGVDPVKDQTLFLSRVSQSALRHCCFPVGHLRKAEVRRLATEAGLAEVARKPDSSGICFIGTRHFRSFIDQYLEPKPGDFIDIDTGVKVGTHQGIHQWTLGQRCNIPGCIRAYFVARKVPATQTIYVASGTDHPSLYSDQMLVESIHWIAGSEPEALSVTGQFCCQFRFQHTCPLVACQIEKRSNDERLQISLLDGPLRALTPGQYAVFYKDEECLGSARIMTVASSVPDPPLVSGSDKPERRITRE